MQEGELATCRQSSQSCRGTTIHKLKPQANCYWVERQRDFHICKPESTHLFIPPHTHHHLQKQVLCIHIKNYQNLDHQKKVFKMNEECALKESTFYWETQMGGCFKTKQTALLLTHLLSEQNCTALQLRHNMWDSSSPGLWEKSLHSVCRLWRAMLAGVSASGWKTCCQRSNNSHKEKNYSPPLIQRKRRWWDISSL